MKRYSPEDIYKRNIVTFYITDLARALVFLIPVWVAYELQYITLTQLTLLEATIYGIQLVFELPTGALADLIGKKWTVLFGNAFVFISLVLYALARDFHAFIIYAFFMGLGESLISGAQEALLYDTIKEVGREKEYSLIHSKISLAFQATLAFSIFTGGLLGSISYLHAIWATAIATLVSVIGCFFFIEPLIDSEKFTLARYIRQTKEGFTEIFKTPYIKKISLFYILVGGITWVCNLVFNMTLLTQKGFTAGELGTIMSIVRVVNGFVLFRGLHIGTIFTKERTFILFPIIMSICLLPGIFFTKWIAVIAVAGLLFSSTARWVILGKYTNDEFSSKNRATAISTLSMAIGLIYVVVSIISGPIMTWYGNVGIIYTLLGIITILFIFPLGLTLRNDHTKERKYRDIIAS